MSKLVTGSLDPKYTDKRTADKPRRVQELLVLNDMSTPTRTPRYEDGRTWIQDTPESIRSGKFTTMYGIVTTFARRGTIYGLLKLY